jgi:uncharacterized protein YceK
MRLTIVLVFAVTAALLAGCSGDTSPDEGDTGAPAAAAPTSAPDAEPAAEATSAATAPDATAEPTQAAEPVATQATEPEPVDTPAAAVAAVPTVVIVIPEGCAPGASTDEQKERLKAIAAAMFPGITNKERPRLMFEPEARDHRQGGIWIVAEFNGDELETVVMRKAALDRQMRDTYDALFNSGCDELFWVDLTGIQEAVTTREIGNSVVTPVVVFKTRMTRTVADDVDWASKEDLDFNDIWKELLINPRWRTELREAESAP